MAQTKQTEEAGVDIVAAVRRATAETAVQAQECEDLEQRLAQTKEKIGMLEREITCMQMHAAKRAQQKSKVKTILLHRHAHMCAVAAADVGEHITAPRCITGPCTDSCLAHNDCTHAG